jgi:hypothetical protein
MENSVDLINTLIETLIKEYCALPAFSTLVMFAELKIVKRRAGEICL